MAGVLWIVQDGILAGPGASQTVPYVRGLAREGFAISLLSFEKDRFLADRERVRRVRRELAGDGVAWTALPYGSGGGLRRTALQFARAAATGRGRCRAGRVALVHARSYVPGLMALALGRPFLFDMRGLWPRERVDAGLWPEDGALHRIGLRLERLLLERARGVVLLAEGAREHLPEIEAPVRVIPTAADLTRFRPGLPPPAGAEALADRRVFVVAGALGSWYLLDEMLDLLALALERDARAQVLLLTEEDPRGALAGLRERGVPPERITVRGVPHQEVPGWFSLATAGVMFIASAPSKRASAPTKLAELLGCGVPVLLTPGVGDTRELVEETRTGVIVSEHTRAAHAAALDQLKALRAEGGELRRRCRETAVERLDLTRGVTAYAGLYREILEGAPCC